MSEVIIYKAKDGHIELNVNLVHETLWLSQPAADGKKYKTKFYNLDAVISVGYRVNSNQAT